MIHFQPAPAFLEDWDWSSAPQKPGWQQLSNGAAVLQSRIGTGGQFRDYVSEAKALLADFRFERFLASLESRSMIRAFVHAWLSEPMLAESTLRIETVEAISASKAGISRLGTVALIHLHLTYFDRVDLWQSGLFDAIEKAVSQAVDSQKRNATVVDVVETVRSSPHLVIKNSAAKTAAALIVDGEHTLEGLLSDLKLSGFEARRYRQILNHEVYLRRIEAADPHGNNSFLSELPSDAIRKAPRAEGGFFGLSLLEALISRPTATPSLEWINTILDIAGDPRMSFTQNWSVWWQPLSVQARETVIRWLSEQDLELFLRTIEEYGVRTGNLTLQRMYPDRQQFLRGLQKSGLVRETRLFMPESARTFASRTLPSKILQTISRLDGTPDRSLIFIDCGGFHIIEGSHNFKIWIYEGTPHVLLTSRERYSTNIDELRQPLADQYQVKGQRYKSVTHNGIWQYPALFFLRRVLHVDLEPSKMMTTTSYQEMLSKKGMP